MARNFIPTKRWINNAKNAVKKMMNNEDTIQTEEQVTAEATETTQEVVEEVVIEISEVEKLETELGELKDKYLRLYADFENFRRRTSREKLELMGTANEELMKAVLPVVDDFERAMGSFETATEIVPLKEGVGLIFTKLTKTLESRGLKSMISKGEVFNADFVRVFTKLSLKIFEELFT